VPLAVTFFVRGVMAPFVHPVFTALTGLGLGLAARTRPGAPRWLAPAGGLAGAFFLHSLWNTSASIAGGAAFVGVFFTIMVPLFAALLVLVAVARRHEGRLIATGLGPEVGAGVLTHGDVMVLSALHERRSCFTGRRRTCRPGGGAGGHARRLVCRPVATGRLALVGRQVLDLAPGELIDRPRLGASPTSGYPAGLWLRPARRIPPPPRSSRRQPVGWPAPARRVPVLEPPG
jgi:hypothetical protein